MLLSRNKVAVPEGAAGTPPFWSEAERGWFPLVLQMSMFNEIKRERASRVSTDEVELNHKASPIAQLVRALH